MRQQPEWADVVRVQALDFQLEDGMHPRQALQAEHPHAAAVARAHRLAHRQPVRFHPAA